MRALLAVLLALVALSASADASACEAATVTWAAACSARGQLQVIPLRCPSGVLVMSVARRDEPPFEVEIARARPGTFRTVGDLALSPLGDIPDWETTSPATKEGFERLTACVAAAPPELPSGAITMRATPTPRGRGWPALLVLAAIAGLGGLAVNGWRPTRRRLSGLGALLALAVATFLLRRLFAPGAYFHQNGHGPIWMGYALTDPSPYGPGFRETFGWAASLFVGKPEAGVFLVQAVAMALGPPAALTIARRVGAPPVLAWAVAIAVAIDPLFARLASSESYYAASSSLLLLATAIAAGGVGARRALSSCFVLTTAAAALIVAQSCRIHPTGWVASALVPLVHLHGRGTVPRRIGRVVAAGIGIGAIVALTSGRVITEILGGGTGDKWLPGWRAALPSTMASMVPVVLLVLGASVAFSRRRREGWLPAVALSVVLVAIAFADMHRGTLDWVAGAYRRLYAGALVAAGTGVLLVVLRSERRRRVAALAVVVLAVASAIARRRFLTELPTDALEYRAAMGWRDLLGPDARVIGLGHARKRELDLRVFELGRPPGKPSGAETLDVDAPILPLSGYGEGAVYYRSSLCSTTPGRPVCEALERSATLVPIATSTLPGRPSMVGLDYDADRISIGLYRITAPSPAPGNAGDPPRR